ncbi:hypothetical protein OSB04_026815 [Centaurea solstitialis]|uniref:Cytochrome P450 n=1 Tax=Centaurea solstitialis TaxID=347529 RepID=A0AA38SDZ6_9ASTR|nr:hypothetical protein OSB04_026815 [Centaurea solstitialis]
MIILTRADLVHEALIENGAIFATRPAENATRSIFSSNKFTVNASSYGPVWRSLRRNIVQNGLSAAKLRTFRHVRETAMDKLVERLKSESQANGGAVWVLKNTRFAMFCILLSMCFGVEMDEKTIEKIDDMMKTVLITLDPRIDDFMPLLRPFFSKKRNRAIEVRNQQIATLVPIIERRRAAVKDQGPIPPRRSSRTSTPFRRVRYPTGYECGDIYPAISEDPKLWTNPTKFDPDRFLTGAEDADITGVTAVKMMPFGVGRRICPGLGLATVHINLVLARMVQEFEWSSYPEDSKVDFSEKFQFTVVMKNSLRAMIKPRV